MIEFTPSFEDEQDLEEGRTMTAAQVNRRCRRANIIQRTLFGLTLGLGIAGGVTYSQDSEATPWVVGAALPLGTVGAVVQHNAKKYSANLVAEFLRLQEYAKNEGIIEPGEVNTPAPSVPPKQWHDYIVSPEVASQLSSVFNGLGLYAVTAEAAVDYIPPPTTPVTYIGAAGVFVGTALYGIAQRSMNGHQQHLLQQLGVQESK